MKKANSSREKQMNINTKQTLDRPASEMSVRTFFSVLARRRKYLIVIIGIFAAVSLAISFSYKPGCSVSCVLAVGSLGGGQPLQSPDDTVSSTLANFPNYAVNRVFPDAGLNDVQLWSRTFYMANAGPGLVRITGRTYSAAAATTLATGVVDYVLAQHKIIYDAERDYIKARISEFSVALSAAAKIESKGLAHGPDSPEILLSRTFSGWAKTELIKLRRQARIVGESRILSGPAVSCTTRSFQVVFNLFLSLLLGTLVALLVILWMESWRHSVDSVF